jgi:CubicO group peptidase (beta-lactamase class C family)
MNGLEGSLQAILDKTTDGKRIFGTSFAVKKDGISWVGAAGNLSVDQPYFIASTTKLFTTAIVLRLKSEEKLSIDDRINKYLDAGILNGLHIYKGREYSFDLTIKHLLAHTSGLPDYFQNKGPDGRSLEDELIAGDDQFWSFEQAIGRSKAMKPLFIPGTIKKAHYSDTNFQLLGRIIESITGKSYSDNCNELIIKPLSLSDTYLYTDSNDATPKIMYYKSDEIHIPKAMTSFGPDGGIVSTSYDMLTFAEAFFKGKLFPFDYINNLQEWNKIFFPMISGIGIHKFELPWFFNPTGTIPYFIGHSGLSGALAFYSPKENIFITGTVNQVAHTDLSFRTMIKLAQMILKSVSPKHSQ